MKQVYKITMGLCGIWAATLLYGEMFAFKLPSMCSCSWPHLHHPHASSSIFKMNGVGAAPGDYVKVAVIADPQIMDKTSLHLPPKSSLLETAQFYTDIYMRRAFLLSILPLKPDVILFLGDYFDGGPYLSDQEWQESLHRFRHIFGMNSEGGYADMPVFFIPGNHDIGYSAINSNHPEVVRRYEEKFGRRNFRFTVGKVEFIAVDSQTLDGHPSGNLTSDTWEFITNVSKDIQSVPRVLLTHIPLYRQDNTSCGSLRGSQIINQRISHSFGSQEMSYQNFVIEESSSKLLELIKPALILSGHDHDQCTVRHESESGNITEHTVGTISWQQGNLYPSFMLLSVSNSPNVNMSSPEDVLISQLCFLPKQLHIYMWYLSLYILTILALLFWPTSGIDFEQHFSGLSDCVRLYSSKFGVWTKEKIEDENCDYEMMWDAEGTMILVKKALAPTSRPTEKISVERGNAVIRAAARKTVSEETQICMKIDVGHDPDMKLQKRTMRSKTKMIMRRQIRTFQMVVIVTVVNLPIYLMLLFKDWIDQ
ncbi:Calcineurin-like metallo-phosphoesterase superfamily protein [Euphorbia peplus]|nr:Calcineurin-like metallo-phosphoesterase superfamily protein [Euphorbia peplus]